MVQVVDGLNKLSTNFTVILAGSAFGSADGTISDDNKTTEAQRISGFYSGNFYQIIKDVAITGGFSFDRIDDHFYIGASPVALSMCMTSTIIETSLSKEDLDSLKSSFGQDVDFTLTSSKILISGRFYSVKQFRQYVEQLNEVKRCYVARLVFVRLERSKISRLEAEIKASSLDLISQGYDLYSMFESQLDVKFSQDNSYNFSEQLLYCSDGQKSSLKIGSTFEREKRSVSDYGTSTVSGYQSFEDGVNVELTPRRSLNGVVELELRFGNSKFSDVSTLSKNQVDLVYDSLTLQENRLYYIASLSESDLSAGSKLLGLNTSAGNKVLTCWLCISPVVSTVTKNINEGF